jgi:cell division protein FtsB
MKKFFKQVNSIGYKKNYVECKYGFIYSEKSAIKNFPKYKRQIKKVVNKNLKPADVKKLTTLKFSIFPDNQAMVDRLLIEREEIYKKTNIKALKIQGLNTEIMQAFVIADYIGKNIKYTMTTVEEIEWDHSDKYYKLKRENDFKISEINDLKNKLNKAKKQAKKDVYSHFIKSLEKSQKQIEKKLKKLEIYEQNRTTLENIYNSMIYGRGVCNDFSYEEAFLHEGLNIDCRIIDLWKKGEKDGHAANIIKFKKDNVKGYYISDVTNSLLEYKMYNDEFATGGHGVFKDWFFESMDGKKITKIRKLIPLTEHSNKRLEENIDCVSSIKQIENQLLNESVIIKELLNAAAFIANGYKVADKILEVE